MPNIATHVAVWYFRGQNKDVSAPVATYAVSEKSKTRQFDMVHQFNGLVAILRLNGFRIKYTVSDAHRSNVVSVVMMVTTWNSHEIAQSYNLDQAFQKLMDRQRTVVVAPSASSPRATRRVKQQSRADAEHDDVDSDVSDDFLDSDDDDFELPGRRSDDSDLAAMQFDDVSLVEQFANLDETNQAMIVDQLYLSQHALDPTATVSMVSNNQSPDITAPIPSSFKAIPKHTIPNLVPTTREGMVTLGKAKCRCIADPFNPGEIILLASDTSHMLKNLRNNLFASRVGGSRNLVYSVRNGDGSWTDHPMSWSVIEKAFEYSRHHHASTRPSPLTHTAVNINNFTKMGMRQLFALVHPQTIQLLEDLYSQDRAILGEAALGTIYYLRDLWTLLYTMLVADYGFKDPTNIYLRRCADIVEYWRLQREHLASTPVDNGDVRPRHISDETFDSLENCVYGMVTMVADMNKVGQKETYVYFPNTDRVENWFGYLRGLSRDPNPTIQQVGWGNGKKISKYQRRSHPGWKQQTITEGTDDALPGHSVKSVQVPWMTTSLSAIAAELHDPRKLPPSDFDPKASWPLDVTATHDTEAALTSDELDSATEFSVEKSIRATILAQLGSVTGADVSGCTAYITQVPCIVSFVEYLAADISFKFRRGNSETALKFGGRAWQRDMTTAFVMMLSRFFDPTVRIAAWKRAIAHHGDFGGSTVQPSDEIVAIVSFVTACEAFNRIVAVGIALADVDSGEIESEPGVQPRPNPSEAHEISLEDILGLLEVAERRQLRYITGWVCKRLLEKRKFIQKGPQTVVEASNKAALNFVLSMDRGIGAYLSEDVKLHSGQRLHVAAVETEAFLLKLEWYIRNQLLTSENLWYFRENLPYWVNWTLSRSAYVRKIWQELVIAIEATGSQPQMSKLTPEASVALLESFVRIYLRSRVKTHRINSGLVPESADNTAIRQQVKLASVTSQHLQRMAADQHYRMLISVIANMSQQFNRSACSTGILALFHKDHGVVFDEHEGKFRVTSTPAVYKPGAIFGHACNGDIVDRITTIRRGKERTVKLDLAKTDNATLYPCLIRLIRKPVRATSV
jgi:hypothetical protein